MGVQIKAETAHRVQVSDPCYTIHVSIAGLPAIELTTSYPHTDQETNRSSVLSPAPPRVKKKL
jgi:hypothetical protein